MSNKSKVILAHRGECKGAHAYEDMGAPFDAERLLLHSLCAEKLAPEKIIPTEAGHTAAHGFWGQVLCHDHPGA